MPCKPCAMSASVQGLQALSAIGADLNPMATVKREAPYYIAGIALGAVAGGVIVLLKAYQVGIGLGALGGGVLVYYMRKGASK